jgi:hypothetical protein
VSAVDQSAGFFDGRAGLRFRVIFEPRVPDPCKPTRFKLALACTSVGEKPPVGAMAGENCTPLIRHSKPGPRGLFVSLRIVPTPRSPDSAI